MDGEQKLRTAAVKVLEKLGYVVNLKRGKSFTAKRQAQLLADAEEIMVEAILRAKFHKPDQTP